MLDRLLRDATALKYLAYALLGIGLVLEVVDVVLLFTNPWGILLMCAGSFLAGIRYAMTGPDTQDPAADPDARKRAVTVVLILVATVLVFAWSAVTRSGR